MWEKSPDFDQQHEAWQTDGPTLPVEFARISSKRDGALTLVIDRRIGTTTTVFWCLTKRTAIEDVVCDLRCREGTTIANIDRMLVRDRPDTLFDETAAAIHTWAGAHKLTGVVWTALKSNFLKDQQVPFSEDSAQAYLRSLPANGRTMAAEYFYRAPACVQTPIRTMVASEPWFLQECERHAHNWSPNPSLQRTTPGHSPGCCR